MKWPSFMATLAAALLGAGPTSASQLRVEPVVLELNAPAGAGILI